MTKQIRGGQRGWWAAVPRCPSSPCAIRKPTMWRLLWPRSTPWRRPGARSSGWPCRTRTAAKAVDKIKEQIAIPLIADIHFNYQLALMCAERGIDAIRINPGNIGGEEKVQGGGGHLPPKGHPHPHRRQRRLFGKGAAGQVRRRHRRGAGGERHGPCGAAEPVRF